MNYQVGQWIKLPPQAKYAGCGARVVKVDGDTITAEHNRYKRGATIDILVTFKAPSIDRDPILQSISAVMQAVRDERPFSWREVRVEHHTPARFRTVAQQQQAQHHTAVDIVAAKITGLDLAAKHSADVLYAAHMAHPEVLALREGFLAAQVNDIVTRQATVAQQQQAQHGLAAQSLNLTLEVAQDLIAKAEKDLGTLSRGMRIDLLLDNTNATHELAAAYVDKINREAPSGQQRVEAAIATLKARGWTNANVEAFCDQHAMHLLDRLEEEVAKAPRVALDPQPRSTEWLVNEPAHTDGSLFDVVAFDGNKRITIHADDEAAANEIAALLNAQGAGFEIEVQS